KKDIDNTKILVPPLDLLKKFDTISKNIFGRIFTTNQEIQTLSKTRDLLLPKLMSGKIRVPMEVKS
ncbi:MAG: restriction endonuclease subunit S, partial [Candidatus Heimdallarchaeaceae archaeon]